LKRIEKWKTKKSKKYLIQIEMIFGTEFPSKS